MNEQQVEDLREQLNGFLDVLDREDGDQLIAEQIRQSADAIFILLDNLEDAVAQKVC
jgi:hypothetical protein